MRPPEEPHQHAPAPDPAPDTSLSTQNSDEQEPDTRRRRQREPRATAAAQPCVCRSEHDALLKLVAQMKDDQARTFELIRQKLTPEVDIVTRARRLWESEADVRLYSAHPTVLRRGEMASIERELGRSFLDSRAPCGKSNVWIGRSRVSFMAGERGLCHDEKERLIYSHEPLWEWMPNLEAAKRGIARLPVLLRRIVFEASATSDGIDSWWPREWPEQRVYPVRYERFNFEYSCPGTFEKPVSLYSVYDGVFMNTRDIPAPEGVTMNGIVLRVEYDPDFKLSADCLASILCMWESPCSALHRSYNPRATWHFQGVPPHCLNYASIGHFSLKSNGFFVNENLKSNYFRAIKCEIHSFDHLQIFDPKEIRRNERLARRQTVTLNAFYSQNSCYFTERRYSLAICGFPLARPSGYYSLVSIVDAGAGLTTTVDSDRLEDWKRHGILPAGRFTGDCVFQLELCNVIKLWLADWDRTMDAIDDLVSLNVMSLQEDVEIRNAMLSPDPDSSVKYFKTLQILRIFTDRVRKTTSYIEEMLSRSRPSMAPSKRYKETHPDLEDTEAVLNHNWDIVEKLQKDAEKSIIGRFERTTAEVQSLMDGLFNVQSINEAQKGIALNKYLFIFTVVTIAFLPPSFVTSFFSTGLFDAASNVATQTRFWCVLAGLSGGTYILAGLGLFGSNFITTRKRKEWIEKVTRTINETMLRIVDAPGEFLKGLKTKISKQGLTIEGEEPLA